MSGALPRTAGHAGQNKTGSPPSTFLYKKKSRTKEMSGALPRTADMPVEI